MSELLAALEAAIDAFKRRRDAPPPPLFIPGWVVTVTEAELGSPEAAHEWLDSEARLNGFDGYVVFAVAD